MAPDIEIRPKSGLWKDSLNTKTVKELAKQLGRASKKFDQAGFASFILNENFNTLELKERINAIADALKEFLPKNYTQVIKIIIKTAPHVGTFENWALLTYIEKFGLNYFDESVSALETLTRYSTAEFAIRPYMIQYPDKMIPILHRWVRNENEHVRRLVAEGTRPRGVWMAHIERFKKDPTEVLKLLERLKADSSLYVRKAVANNLNDISKDHPMTVIKLGKKWLNQNCRETNWIVKHGCRTLVKQGHPEVFPLFGFTENPQIKISNFKINNKKVKIGDSAIISFDLLSQTSKNQKLAIDYKLYYMKKNGTQSPKIFKLSEKKIAGNQQISLSTKHSFKDMTTRKHYAGKHKIELVINGNMVVSLYFSLS